MSAITASAAPSAPPSPPSASSASTIPASVAAAISTAVVPLTSIVSRPAVSANSWRIISCRVVTGSKVLRCRSVRFRLALLYLGNFRPIARSFIVSFAVALTMIQAVALFAQMTLVAWRVIQMQNLLVYACRSPQRLAWKHFDRRHTAAAVQRSCRNRRFSVSVIVIFQIFENVADVQEGVSIQADVHECGLHSWQDSRYFSFVDAADERKFLLALNVDFD